MQKCLTLKSKPTLLPDFFVVLFLLAEVTSCVIEIFYWWLSRPAKGLSNNTHNILQTPLKPKTHPPLAREAVQWLLRKYTRKQFAPSKGRLLFSSHATTVYVILCLYTCLSLSRDMYCFVLCANMISFWHEMHHMLLLDQIFNSFIVSMCIFQYWRVMDKFRQFF